MGQIHGLLLTSEEPLTAEDISECLGIARSNVSTSLRELQGWGIVKIQHQVGDRRDHFVTERDPMDIISYHRPRTTASKYYPRWTC